MKYALLFILLLFFSCKNEKSDIEKSDPVVAETVNKTSPDIVLDVFDFNQLEPLLSKNDDKIYVINFWATWCAPCREEFSDLVKLANEYGEEIDVIGISVDFPEEIDTKIIPFLKKQNAVFANYVIKVVEPENFINLLNEDWSGAIPATFVYDEKGNQVEYLIGKQTYEEFEKVVKKL